MPAFDPEELETTENRRIMRTATTPRPIGWISTTSEDGVDNLAPFSNYNNVCTARPAVMFSAGSHGEGLDKAIKHTAQNVFDVGEFVVNVVTESVVEKMLRTSDQIPREESEFDYADVEREQSEKVTPPRVAEAVINLECTFHDSLHVFDNRLIVGKVEYIHVSERVMTDGKIDMNKVDTVGRIGGPDYTTTDPLGISYRDYYE